MYRENWHLNGEAFTFVTGWQEDAAMRQKLHPLTREIFGFDFEQWYQNGWWTDTCIPYSLLAGERLAAHITVSLMDFLLEGEKRRYVQLGTVMTAPDYRGRGLSRALMERVLADWREKSDLVFLFANQSVLDFYPRFGFSFLTESEASFPLEGGETGLPVRPLNMDDAADRTLLERMTAETVPQASLSMMNGTGLVMFYCDCFEGLEFRRQLYWLETLSAVAVAHSEGDALVLSDIFSPRAQDVREIARALAGPETRRAVLEYLPADAAGCTVAPYEDKEGALFALGPDVRRLKERPFRFPVLSHT